jgi:hypothetical protein
MLAKHKVGSSTLLTRSIFKPLISSGAFFSGKPALGDIPAMRMSGESCQQAEAALEACQAANLDSRVSKVDVLNGLRIKSLHPASNHLHLSMRLALIARIGIDLVLVFLFRRNNFANSKPFISGRLRSRSMMLGLFCSICFSASFPELTCDG